MAKFQTRNRLVLMTDETASRLGVSAPLLAEHAKIPVVIVLTADDCFPDADMQREFFAGNFSEDSARAALEHFTEQMNTIHPGLADMGAAYRDIIFKYIMTDRPMSLPVLGDSDHTNVGFIVLGSNHDTGHKLAEKLANIAPDPASAVPSHRELETITLFHELDHLRPEKETNKAAATSAQKLEEETGRDAFSLRITHDLVSEDTRRAFLDYRLLGGIHGSDADHRTALGLLTLDDPEHAPAEQWEALSSFGDEMTAQMRPKSVLSGLSGIFGDDAKIMNTLNALESVAPIAPQAGYDKVTALLQNADAEDHPERLTILQETQAAYVRTFPNLNQAPIVSLGSQDAAGQSGAGPVSPANV